MKTTLGIIGSGWRAEFYLRAAKALPDLFEVAGVVTRSPEKAAHLIQRYGVPCYDTPDALLSNAAPAYVVVSVNKQACGEVAVALGERGVPILMETPPATDLPGLLHLHASLPKGAIVQVAEQYPLQPMHAACLSYLNTGKLGKIQHVQVSCTQGYHAMALIRRYLGLGFENAEITAASFPVASVMGPGRSGDPLQETVVEKQQTVAVLHFEDRTALFSFEADQHRAWIRSQVVQVKGERGELFNTHIRYLLDYHTPMESAFIRKHLGQEENLEGVDLKGILGDGQWHYRNPYQGSRLSDDEIAVAACMEAMACHVQGGPPLYSLAEASQDVYLSLMVEQAARQGCTVGTETQIWAE